MATIISMQPLHSAAVSSKLVLLACAITFIILLWKLKHGERGGGPPAYPVPPWGTEPKSVSKLVSMLKDPDVLRRLIYLFTLRCDIRGDEYFAFVFIYIYRYRYEGF